MALDPLGSMMGKPKSKYGLPLEVNVPQPWDLNRIGQPQQVVPEDMPPPEQELRSVLIREPDSTESRIRTLIDRMRGR